MDKPVIETIKLTKTYPGIVPVTVLKGIDLTVKEGELTAIVGASGSGKSTLLNMLGALDRPTEGKIFIDCVDINTLNDNSLADLRNKKIGFIFQFHYLLAEFTALENALFPSMINRGRILEEDRERTAKLLTDMGLGKRLKNKPSELSGGEQQRVAIARALSNSPKIILADEPTGNLDTQNTQLIFNLLRDLNLKYNITFLLVTHDQNLAKQMNRIITIKDGEIVNDVIRSKE
jgi:lipoprotein-releasing system ATP-binding protein